MSDIETFGITLPVGTWQELFRLSRLMDRSPSDYLRTLIQLEADRQKLGADSCNVQSPSRNQAMAV